jgi:hypothetical protein
LIISIFKWKNNHCRALRNWFLIQKKKPKLPLRRLNGSVASSSKLTNAATAAYGTYLAGVEAAFC